MAGEKNYYTIDPQGKLSCLKCGVPLVKGKAKFMYLDNGFPVELPVCPVCGFVYVPEELALGKVASPPRRRGTHAPLAGIGRAAVRRKGAGYGRRGGRDACASARAGL